MKKRPEKCQILNNTKWHQIWKLSGTSNQIKSFTIEGCSSKAKAKEAWATLSN